MVSVISLHSIAYQYINFMNSPFLGNITYTWYDLSAYSTRKTIPLDSNNPYKVGILQLTSVGQALIPEDNIQILNRDFPGPDVILPKTAEFAAPTEAHVIYFVGIDNSGTIGSVVYYIAVNNEPYSTEFPSPLYKIWYNPSYIIPMESRFAVSYSDISADSRLSNALRRMIISLPLYSDTGDLNKHGIMSAFNILVKNIEVTRQLVQQKDYDLDALNTMNDESNLLPSWREKRVATLFSEFTENDKIAVRKSYNFSDNTPMNAYVLGYILDNIYSKVL